MLPEVQIKLHRRRINLWPVLRELYGRCGYVKGRKNRRDGTTLTAPVMIHIRSVCAVHLRIFLDITDSVVTLTSLKPLFADPAGLHVVPGRFHRALFVHFLLPALLSKVNISLECTSAHNFSQSIGLVTYLACR